MDKLINATRLCACRFLRSSHAPLRLLCTYYVRLLSVAQSSSFAHQFHLGIMKNHCIDSWAGRILWKMRASSCWGFIIIVCCWIIASSPNSPAHPIYIELCCFTLFSHIIEKLAESVTNIHVEKKTYTVNQSHLSYIAFSLCHIMGSKSFWSCIWFFIFFP